METKLTVNALKEIVNGDLGGAREMMDLKVKVDTLIEEIIKNVQNEYDEFKKDMFKQTKDYLFKEAYMISSYTNLLYYFENGGFYDKITSYLEYVSTDDDNIKKLEAFSKQSILEVLYQKHFKYETLYFDLWDDIDLLIEYVVFDNK